MIKDIMKEKIKSNPWIFKTLVVLSLAVVAFNLFYTASTVFGSSLSAVSAGASPTGGFGGSQQAGTAQGDTRPYGLVLDNTGFQKLLGYDRSINVASLSPEQKAVYTKLLGRDDKGKVIIPHPCCGVSISECAPCDHGKAIRGLIKYLLQQGWSEKDILSESLIWDRVFFPGQVP